MIHFVTPRGQEFGILGHLEEDGRDIAHRFAIVHYETLARGAALAPGTYILSALDQLTPIGIEMTRRVEAALRSAGPGVRVLNSVDRSLCRFDLLAELAFRGRNPHRVVRADGDLSDLRFPVFLREEHWHTASVTPLLRTRAELNEQLAHAALRGSRSSELLVVEYCDTSDDRGTFHKYAAICIGLTIVPQFVDSGASWILNRDVSEYTLASVAAELAYVRDNPHRDALREIFDLAGIDYGRIDYAVKDGTVVTWEINMNPTIGAYDPLPPELDAIRAERRALFSRMMREAFEAVDVPQGQGRVVTIPPLARRHRTSLVRRRPPNRIRHVAALLSRPTRPLLRALVRRVAKAVADSHARRDGT